MLLVEKRSIARLLTGVAAPDPSPLHLLYAWRPAQSQFQTHYRYFVNQKNLASRDNMSIGKINASLMGGLAQETTMTLANLNFDFALCKIEAPAEYQGLGEYLSTRHRAAAETGNEHILAGLYSWESG